MIIEMCGLPASGKSYLINKCKFDPKQFGDRKKLFRMVRYRSQILKIVPDGLPLKEDYNKLRTFYKEYPASSKVFRQKLLRLNYAINCCSSNNFILDEGPIQYITSIPFDKKIIENQMLRDSIAILCKDEPLLFYCKCPVSLSMERLRGRKMKGYMDNGRYDIDDDRALKELLEMKRLNIEACLKHFRGKIIELDMQSSEDENIRIIKSNILKICK